MSLPPQPGSWQPPQQAQGARGEQPYGQPYGSPPPGYQQPWYPPPGPPRKGGGAKWVLLVVAALVAVVAVAVAVTVVVLHSNSGGNSKGSTTSTTGTASGIASANDNGPVTVITNDPSCAPWNPVETTLAATEQQNGWDKRDPSIPASAWSPEQRAQFQAVGTAMRNAADQLVALAKLTPHRVMRELYEQTIAYMRAYADRIPDYTPNDDPLARVEATASSAIGQICGAIAYDSAAARGPLIAAPAPPTQTSSPVDPAKPQRFLTANNSICPDWKAAAADYDAASAEWQKTDPNTPASQWSPEQKALNDAVGPVMSSFADKKEQLGRRSGNPTLEDFAVLSAEYNRAYVQALPTYVRADGYLNDTASYSSGVIATACEAVGS
jgi:hypothetical protein